MGRPKSALVMPGGESLLARTLAMTEAFAAERWMVGADAPRSPGVKYLADDFPGEGPLAAAATVLTHATRDWVLLLACDVPQLTVDVVERLRGMTGDDADVVMAQGAADDRANPLVAYYRATLSRRMRAAVEAGEQSLTRFLKGVTTRVVTVQQPASLASVNTPDEWEAFLREAREAGDEKKEASEDASED